MPKGLAKIMFTHMSSARGWLVADKTQLHAIIMKYVAKIMKSIIYS